MTKIKAWEELCKNPDAKRKSYVTRIGDSAWGLEPYQYGFIVGRIESSGKGGYKLNTETAKYPSDLFGLIKVVSNLGHTLTGDVATNLEEALAGQIKAAEYAAQLANKLEKVIKNVA